MSSYSRLGFTNMEYTPTSTVVMPPLEIKADMTPQEIAAYEKAHPEETQNFASPQKGWPWWLLLVAAGAYYYSQKG
jgi:hypothetical protein